MKFLVSWKILEHEGMLSRHYIPIFVLVEGVGIRYQINFPFEQIYEEAQNDPVKKP